MGEDTTRVEAVAVVHLQESRGRLLRDHPEAIAVLVGWCLVLPASVRAEVEFLGQAFPHAGYDYAPSFMFGDGPEIRSWWCGQGPTGDNVYHASWGPGGWHDVRVVLAPTPGSWDGVHACDPSVVMGAFVFEGTTYRYAMYYTGTDHGESGGIENRVGVAFSNDGLNWIKRPDPVVLPAAFPSGTYGAGMPSAWSPGGSEVWLAYLDATGSPANGTFLRQSADGVSFGPPAATTLDGGRGQQAADIAYDGDLHRWLAATKMDRDLNVILLQSCGDPTLGADSIYARWIEVGFFNGTNTGRPMNHNPGLLRWPSGNARHDEAGSFFVQFGFGDFDPATWELAWGRFTAAPDGDGDCHLPPGDCDDGDRSIHPGAEEDCDGLDDDCDGATDEDCPAGDAGTDATTPDGGADGGAADSDGNAVDSDGDAAADAEAEGDGDGEGEGGDAVRPDDSGRDGGTDRGVGESGPAGDGSEGGCGCAVPRRPAGASGALWILLAAAARTLAATCRCCLAPRGRRSRWRSRCSCPDR